MDKDKILERTKRVLGAPIIVLELTDEHFDEAYETALDSYKLFSNISGVNAWSDDLKAIWVKNYTIAASKEILGRMRGKFSGKVPVPGAELTLDYKELLKESKEEKNFLFRLRVNNSTEGFILLNNKNV